jgi:hypothetical protein
LYNKDERKEGQRKPNNEELHKLHSFFLRWWNDGELGRMCSTYVDVGPFWNVLLTVNDLFQ